MDRTMCPRQTGYLRAGTVYSTVLWLLVVSWSLVIAPVGKASQAEGEINWREAREFWSFQPPQASSLPKVTRADWVRQPLDHFILARLDQKKLSPAAEAPRRDLLRRVSYTLTGLPPSPEESSRFLADTSPGAYERLVDRLLGTSAFGERLASVWLNLARYAEDQAHQVDGNTKYFYPNAHLYRQWVIDAFNRDMPYDQFVRMQLAADFYEGKIGSGDSPDPDPNRVALGFIGLGPKYYNRGRLDVKADEWEDRVDTVTRTFLGLTVACARCHDHKYDPITMKDYYGLAGIFASTRMVNQKLPDSLSPPKDDKKKANDPYYAMHIIGEDKVRNLHVFRRGNVKDRGDLVERRFLQIFSDSDPKPFSDGSGRRELAEAILAPDNPLTARVMVNRLWEMVFNQGLVSTPSNFGTTGARPSHPELLDYLAVTFREGGWSMKELVRSFVLSATYRQTSRVEASHRERDEANRFYSRMDRQRLTVEMWRDTLLAVTDSLEWSATPSLEISDPANHRRTVYSRISRLKLNDFLMNFDYPDANVHQSGRAVTVTPIQKLYILNSPFIMAMSKGMSDRLDSEAGASQDAAKVHRLYQLLFARTPTEREQDLALSYLAAEGEGNPEFSRWSQYAQVLFASNELFYID